MPTSATLRNELLKDDHTEKASIVGKLNSVVFAGANYLP
jgi:hypothetical protein